MRNTHTPGYCRESYYNKSSRGMQVLFAVCDRRFLADAIFPWEHGVSGFDVDKIRHLVGICGKPVLT